jgi:hypothetical protein
MRRACPKFLRQTFHEFAAQSIPTSTWAKAYYQHHLQPRRVGRLFQGLYVPVCVLLSAYPGMLPGWNTV